MRVVVSTVAAAIASCLAAGAPAGAQNANPQAGAAAQPQQPLWSVQCAAGSREAPPDCAIEQRAVVTETGKLLTKVTVRVPAATRKPVMMVQTPLGPFLPAGIELDIDGASPTRLDYQTCDANGCYAGSPISDDVLQAMFRGKNLNVTVKALNKRAVKISIELTEFTPAYRKIE